MRKIWILIAVLVWGGPAMAERTKTEDFRYPHDSIKTLDVAIELGAGDFHIRSENKDFLALARTEYSPERIRVKSDYSRRGDRGRLKFQSENRRSTNIDTDDNFWDITLSDRYTTEMNIDLGACQAELDLGGIPLVYLDLDIGAAEGKLDFSRPNPGRAEELVIDAGAASLVIKNLGNASFDKFLFDGGVGSFDIDFSGEYKGKSRARLSVGMGKAVLRIPKNLPVRIEADDDFLSSVDFDNAERRWLDDNNYETPDFDKSASGLDLEIDVGLGAIEIIFVE